MATREPEEKEKKRKGALPFGKLVAENLIGVTPISTWGFAVLKKTISDRPRDRAGPVKVSWGGNCSGLNHFNPLFSSQFSIFIPPLRCMDLSGDWRGIHLPRDSPARLPENYSDFLRVEAMRFRPTHWTYWTN